MVVGAQCCSFCQIFTVHPEVLKGFMPQRLVYVKLSVACTRLSRLSICIAQVKLLSAKIIQRAALFHTNRKNLQLSIIQQTRPIQLIYWNKTVSGGFPASTIGRKARIFRRKLLHPPSVNAHVFFKLLINNDSYHGTFFAFPTLNVSFFAYLHQCKQCSVFLAASLASTTSLNKSCVGNENISRKNKMNAKKFVVPMLVALAYGPSQGWAEPILKPALSTFAVLGATGVTNVATSFIGGNLGSAPNGSVGTGYNFTSGTTQPNTPLAQQAELDLDDAIVAVNAGLGALIPGGNLDLYQTQNGGFISPGTYDVPAAIIANLIGNLVLDGGGNSNALWRFRFSSTLVTGSTSNVAVTNVGGGSGVGLYWTVGSGATLNGFTFAGNVLANQTISSDGNLTISCGRLLSAEAQVTLIQDKISTECASTGAGSNGFDQGGKVPEPETFLLFVFGLAGLFVASRKSSLPSLEGAV